MFGLFGFVFEEVLVFAVGLFEAINISNESAVTTDDNPNKPGWSAPSFIMYENPPSEIQYL